MSLASERRRWEMAPPAMVEKATAEHLAEPDWAANMDVCDLVNSDLRQTREVIRAIKKRLTHKSLMVQFLALTLLETMVKNCGDYVHLQVVECEVLFEMVRIVKKKTENPVSDKILFLLDSWQEAFGGSQGKYPQYFSAYIELKASGFKFPVRSGDTAPIFTPPITKLPPVNSPWQRREKRSYARLDEAMAAEKEILCFSDLQCMRRVMELLRDMLEVVNQNDCEALQDEVIIDLVKQCCSNQKKIVHLINCTRNEELLVQALTLNDDLQSLIAKYNALVVGQPVPSAEPRTLSAQSPSPEKSSGHVKEEEGDEDEEDGFTQLAKRNANATGHTSANMTLSDGYSIEEIAGRGSLGGKTNVNTALPGSTQATKVHMGEDIAAHLGRFSIGERPVLSNPCTNGLSTFIPPVPYATTPSSSTDSYFSSSMLSSTGPPPPNTLGLSPHLYSYHNLPANFPTNPYITQSQLHPFDQGYIPNTGYIVPWARQPLQQSIYELQPGVSENPSSYPPPPWETSPIHGDDNFLTTYGLTEHEPRDPTQLQISVHSRGGELQENTATDPEMPSSFSCTSSSGQVKPTDHISMQDHHAELQMERSVPPIPHVGEATATHVNP